MEIKSAKNSLKALNKWLEAANRAIYLKGDDVWTQVEEYYDLSKYLSDQNLTNQKPERNMLQRFSFDALQIGEI